MRNGVPATVPAQQRGKLKSFLVLLTLCVVTLGQWNGARMMLESVYAAFITNFTHHIEYQHLDNVRVGANLNFLESIFGPARLIKKSSTEENLNYRYYRNKKYLLVLAGDEQRIEAFQVISLVRGFQPTLMLNQFQLNKRTFASEFNQPTDFITDNGNLRFYLEQHQLGREGLFLTVYPGTTEYGSDQSDLTEIEYIELINNVNVSLIQGDFELLKINIENLREHVIPNTFTFGKIKPETAADMTLTTHEFRAYFDRG